MFVSKRGVYMCMHQKVGVYLYNNDKVRGAHIFVCIKKWGIYIYASRKGVYLCNNEKVSPPPPPTRFPSWLRQCMVPGVMKDISFYCSYVLLSVCNNTGSHPKMLAQSYNLSSLNTHTNHGSPHYTTYVGCGSLQIPHIKALTSLLGCSHAPTILARCQLPTQLSQIHMVVGMGSLWFHK